MEAQPLATPPAADFNGSMGSTIGDNTGLGVQSVSSLALAAGEAIWDQAQSWVSYQMGVRAETCLSLALKALPSSGHGEGGCLSLYTGQTLVVVVGCLHHQAAVGP